MRRIATLRPWLLPLTTFVLGAAVVLSAWIQRGRVEAHLIRRAQEHVGTVARVLHESTAQTSEAVDLAYQMMEARLHAAILRVAAAGAAKADVAREEGLVVWRFQVDGQEYGDAGPLTDEAVRAGAWQRPQETLFELHLVGVSLACITDEEPEQSSLVCMDAVELSRLRAEAGPGRLFSAILQPPLLYVALEDSAGIIAASPGLPELTGFDSDPILARAQGASVGEVLFRVQPGLREGLAPFELPDGSRAVLRVGLDATLEDEIVADIERRHHALVAVATVAVLLSILAALWLARRARAEALTSAALARVEAENEHWRTIGLLAATVAHEVRNPLNAIQMSAQRLAREFEVPAEDHEEYQALVGLLRSEGARVNEVVTEFLELGRPLNLERKRVEAARVLRDATLPLVARAAAEGKTVAVEDACAGEVDVDPRRVFQIIDNLVRNALDAVPQGGTVRVRGRCEPGGLVVEVEDDGAGMPPETLAQVMEPFFTTKARGTGLGLPLARRLARAHGGDLILSSTPGKGTLAVLTLPPETSEETR
ncbi:MAG: hypothetical protein H6730_32625 [Deltaproteobacteria bacterium]|nr:hypothetical protein [Deltaproteobacteria bacterium]